jgi:hypothetical protein
VPDRDAAMPTLARRRTLAARLSLAALAAFAPPHASGAELAWPEPIASYRMDVRYDPRTHQLHGRSTISWLNASGEAVPDLQLHLYMNAFRNAKSTYLKESESPDEFIAALDGHWGWIDVTRLTLQDGTDLTRRIEFVAPDDGNRDDRTVARVRLPRAVAPGERIQLTVEFEERFPRAVDRSGWAKDFLMAGQWFPKLGVYQPAGVNGRAIGGWNCHQVHAMTEYFADFGDYDVSITVPRRWTIGATGSRIERRANPNSTVTERWAQRGVHDFAWTASPRFEVVTRTFRADREVSARDLDSTARMLGRSRESLRLPDVQVTLLAFPEERPTRERAFRAVFAAIKDYGLWYGPYPYGHLTAVVAPRDGDVMNGMEYPTLFTGHRAFSASPAYVWLESTFAHEFGHQYWYGLVASNEFEESWLDEGINSYSEAKVLDREFGPQVRSVAFGAIRFPGVGWSDLPLPGGATVPLFGIYGTPSWIDNLGNMRRSFLKEPATDAIARPGWEYWNEDTYWVNSYQRPAIFLATLERLVGLPAWPRMMRTYAETFRFQHPTSRDFLTTLNRVTGQDWSWYFDQFLWGSSRLDYEVAKITNDEIADAPGVYERGGKRVTLSERDIERQEREREKREKAAEKKKPPRDSTAKRKAGSAERDATRYRSEVRIRRLGDGFAPVEVAVYFSDHSIAHESWDGRYQWTRFVYEKAARIDSAIVDPGQKLLIDTNRLNNFRAAKADHDPAERWAIHWMLWVQNFLQIVGWIA